MAWRGCARREGFVRLGVAEEADCGMSSRSRYMAGKTKGGMCPGPGELNSGRWAAVCSRQSKRFESSAQGESGGWG